MKRNTGASMPVGGFFMKSSRSLPAVKTSFSPWITIARTDPSSCAAAIASAIA